MRALPSNAVPLCKQLPLCRAATAAAAAPGEGGRRYLAFNPLGCIILKAEEDHNTVEVGGYGGCCESEGAGGGGVGGVVE